MAQGREKATLILATKQALNSGLLVERKVWRVPKSARYPSGLKYRLILVEPKSHEVIVLYDNHWPKGPHIHWNKDERPYQFKGLSEVLKDFQNEYQVEERRYHDNKKNRD